MVGKLLFLFVLQVTLDQQGLAAAEVTCDAPPTVKGDPAIITCHFPHDVQAEKDNVLVQRLPRGASTVKVRPITVLNCTCVSTGDFDCKAGNGYMLLGEVRTTATILIPRAVDWYEGRYTCAEQDSTACEFKLSGLPATRPSTTGLRKPETLDSKDPENGAEPQYFLVLVLVFAVLILVVLCTIVLVKMTRVSCSLNRISEQRKRNRRAHGNRNDTDKEPSEMDSFASSDIAHDACDVEESSTCCFELCVISKKKHLYFEKTPALFRTVAGIKSALTGIGGKINGIETEVNKMKPLQEQLTALHTKQDKAEKMLSEIITEVKTMRKKVDGQ